MLQRIINRKAKEGGDEPAPVRNHMPPVESRSEPRTGRLASGRLT